MGYTHYWNNKGFNQKQFGGLMRDTRKIIKSFNIELSEVSINRSEICFNGVDNLGHETFYLNNKSTAFSFCKTARKPYDKIVMAVLYLASIHNNTFEYSTDGKVADWQPTIDKVNEIIEGNN